MNPVSRTLAGTPAANLRMGRWSRMLRERVLQRLAALSDGYIVLEDAWGVSAYGARAAPLQAHVRIRDGSFYGALAARGSVGAAEAYMAGHWECDDLVALIRILVRNRALLDDMERGTARLGGAFLRLAHALRRNTLAGSRRNIAAHYDLGNEFFALFLSPDLMYSSALWTAADRTLEQASERKLERICARLRLNAADHVLEIGTGWGGFALHAATRYGCRITTTTISREQQLLAQERITRAGLAGRVTVLLEDYRNLSGQYDKLVSIEMIEAIGADYLATYFGQLTRLLKSDGLALLQAITIEDHRYAQALRSVDFIKRHVFPGSFIPSIAAMLAAKTQVSDLGLISLEDFGLSYARTLAAWRAAFLAHLDQVRAQGFDERFVRLWDFYFAYCEGGFRERSIGVAQMLFARPAYRALLNAGDA
ncbi:MAG TPA: cyclopropane-fatty-acyl-phospholipid synthase family protein [Steroidobacteraceae bacterium]|nr:cyclopropane-fatty-acyl-phospholipid synthase family protein [Steroidobacteraceae bacterium]